MPKLKIEKSNINFKNVSFQYDNTAEKAVRDVNITISGGSMSAFVGHSGAGKSTIINLLPRFYDPQNGEILIDNQNIKNIFLNSLRKNISLVSQDVILFDESIRIILRMLILMLHNKKLRRLVSLLQLMNLLKNYQMDTKQLSGKTVLNYLYKKRISIARAVLKITNYPS